MVQKKGFISNADMALATLIWNGIKNNPSAKKLISSQDQILFCYPNATDTQGNRKLSIFLYNITEEKEATNMPPTVEHCKKMITHTTFALRYLITPNTGNDKDDHVLLENIIHIFLASPPIVSSDEENNVGLAVKMDSLSLDELSRMWIALSAPLRISVSLTVSSAEPLSDSQTQITSVAVTPQTSELDTKNVTQLYQSVLKTFTEQFNGWRKRNMVVKQWLLQNFEKNTDMTADEMLTELNNLGDKLEHHGSTAQFIKPLNLLAGYYKHQFDEMKGLHKMTHKQSENLETINTWIKGVKTLVEALGSQ